MLDIQVEVADEMALMQLQDKANTALKLIDGVKGTEFVDQDIENIDDDEEEGDSGE